MLKISKNFQNISAFSFPLKFHGFNAKFSQNCTNFIRNKPQCLPQNFPKFSLKFGQFNQNPKLPVTNPNHTFPKMNDFYLSGL